MVVEVPEVSRELAALITVVSLAMIAIAISLLRQFWLIFERHRFMLPPDKWATACRRGLIISVCLLVTMLLDASLTIRNPDYITPPWLLPVGLVGVPLLISLTDSIIRSKFKKQITPDTDVITYHYSIALSLTAISVLLNIMAVTGVTPTMLSMKLGPLDTASFEWAKWMLAIAILCFFVGMILFGIGFVIDKARELKNKLPKDNRN